MKNLKRLLPGMVLMMLALALTNPAGAQWKDVKNKGMLTSSTAHKVNNVDQADPESVARYFYASYLRKNSDWKKVVHKMESEWTVKMKTAMNAYSQYTFKKVGLQKINKVFENEVHITVYYEATAKGKAKKGTGEIVLQKSGNQWVVHEVPN